MSNLREKLENTSELVFTAEFPSIDGGGMDSVIKNAARLAPWFDAVNATDNPAAHAHTSNTTTAIAMKMHGLEPIMQIVCRDKNRIAIQADMIGASLHGITNLSLLTGDDVTAGDEPSIWRELWPQAPTYRAEKLTQLQIFISVQLKMLPLPHLIIEFNGL